MISATDQDFYLEDNIGNPATGLAGSLSVQVSVDGSTWSAAAGVVTELTGGVYSYALGASDQLAGSFLLLRITDPSILDPLVVFVPADNSISVNETVAANKRLPIYLLDSFGDPYTTIPLLAETFISTNGGGFIAATGSLGTIGSGAFYYECANSELTTLGSITLKVNNGITPEYLWAQPIVDPASGSDAVAPIVTIISTPTDRLQPLVVEVEDETGLAFYELINQDHEDAPVYVIYDSQYQTFFHPFGGKSTVTGTGTSADPYVFTIYRRGGWPTGISFAVVARAYDAGGNTDSE